MLQQRNASQGSFTCGPTHCTPLSNVEKAAAECCGTGSAPQDTRPASLLPHARSRPWIRCVFSHLVEIPVVGLQVCLRFSLGISIC